MVQDKEIRTPFFKPRHGAVEAGSALPVDAGVKCQQKDKEI